MFKVLDKVCEPTRGSKYSACVDLFSSEDVTIGAGETVKIPLGVCIDLIKIKNEIAQSLGYEQWFGGNSERAKHLKYRINDFLESHYFFLEPRSSLRAKGLIVGSGIIDLDYKDEIKMIIHNPLTSFVSFDNDGIERGYINQKAYYNIKKGDKIAQITLLEHKSYLFGIDTKEERKDGFGSTGV